MCRFVSLPEAAAGEVVQAAGEAEVVGAAGAAADASCAYAVVVAVVLVKLISSKQVMKGSTVMMKLRIKTFEEKRSKAPRQGVVVVEAGVGAVS